MPCNIAKFGLSGTQVVTWTELLLKRETDGRCMAVCEGKRSEQTTWWKLPFPTTEIQTERRLSQNSRDLTSSWSILMKDINSASLMSFIIKTNISLQAFSIQYSWIRCTFF